MNTNTPGAIAAAPDNESNSHWVRITDYDAAKGWCDAAASAARSRWCCEQLEAGQILFFDGIPYDFPQTDRDFLLQQRQSDSRIHKNISYRPKQDMLRGSVADSKEDIDRLHGIMRHFSEEITGLLTRVLAPYSAHWSLDYASYRPEEEQNRDLSLHKRNDLLHVDAFPSRPTRGGRILRCFTNINPTRSRNWLTTDRFPTLAEKFARPAGLEEIARSGDSTNSFLNTLKRAVGIKIVDRSAYDKFMLRFHDYLKENSDFQKNCTKIHIAFPPMATWMCYTDSVPHAVLSGQYALEQTFIIPVRALVTPEKSPIRVLEKLAGRSLSREAAAA
jgi:3-deoxy-D-manno-oct-2-ulosonic acid (Kdo) hydroxylase